MSEFNDNFDYGKKRESGQYEHHPVNLNNDPQTPPRNTYFHNVCRTTTVINQVLIIQTYARNPSYYSHTFCTGCKDYKPVSEFVWVENGIITDNEVGK